MTWQGFHRNSVALAAMALISAAAPASATTVVTNAIMGSYYSASPNGPFAYAPGTLHGDAAIIGHFEKGNPLEGYYAALMQFALPNLPDNAAITSSTLSFINATGSLGDTLIMAYATKSADLDSSEIGKGTTFATIRPSGTMSFDLTDIISGFYSALPGYEIGFSFQQLTENCRSKDVYGGCVGSLGYDSPQEYVPTISITYDVVTIPPPPESAVPEPASWAMMIGGFGLIGGLLRKRRAPVSLA